MRRLLFLILFSRLFSASFEDIAPSSPDEIASLSSSRLIDGFISPLSGQPSLSETDLLVKGAHDLHLRRTYIPPQICGRYADKDKRDRYELGKALHRQENRRWAILPHLWAGFNMHSPFFQVRDPNGFVLEFEIRGTRGILKSSACGMSNLKHEEPDSSTDLRNIEFLVETDIVRIIWPDGLERIYRRQTSLLFRLEKELLPNGKAIRYEYQQLRLVRIVSCDPKERHTYAVIEKVGENQYVGSDGRTVSFEYEIREIRGEGKKNGGKVTLKHNALLLAKACNPVYSYSMQYNDRTLLSSYDAKACCVAFDYSRQKGVPCRVERFSTPSGSVFLSYDPPIAGKKGGCTKAVYPDGAEVIYRFNKELLLIAIENWLYSKLVNQKTFHYDGKQHLTSIETRDGAGLLLLAKRFTCDHFGNALVERLEGDFGTFTIRRSFSKNRLIREEREDGRVFEWSWLGNTRLLTSKTTLIDGEVIRKTIFIYDDANNLIEEREEGRTVTKCALYPSGPHLHRIEWKEKRDWEGNLIAKVRFSYDRCGNCSKEEHFDCNGELGFTIHRSYDARGNLLEETNGLGQTAKYRYDRRGRCIQETPFSNRLTILREFDAKGRKILLKEGDHTSRFAYNASDELIEKTDYLGLKTRYTYHPVHGKPTLIESHPTVTRLTYDAFGREIECSDAYGAKTLTRYNGYGSPLEITHPDGGIELFAYASNGTLTKHTDPDGLTTYYSRDPLGRILSQTVGLYATHYVYDSYDLIKSINAKGIESHYRYDSMGRKLEEETANRKTRFGYDPLGFLAWEEKGDRRITYRRDVLGKTLEKSVDGALNTTWTYDPAGNTASICRGGTTSFLYDCYDRLIETTDPTKAKTLFAYEEGVEHLIKQTLDPRGIETLETYDAHGNILKKKVAGQTVEEFAYDKALRLIERDHLTFTYTPEGRKASMTEADVRTTHWTYTPGGKLLTLQKPDGTVLYHEYDEQGRLAKVAKREFRYDELDQLVQGTGFKRTLDPFGNILREEWSNGLWIESTYDEWNRPIERVLPDQSQIAYRYDGPFLKEVIRIDADGQASYTHHYDQYDEAGRLLRETHLLPSHYQFDAAGHQLLKDDPYLMESYAYDPAGNLLQKNDTVYSYDSLSQITSESGQFTARYDNSFNCIEKNGSPIPLDDLNQLEAEEYDANGNLIRPGYIYDEFNQLIEAEGEHSVYDALGRRIERGSLSFLYAGDDEIGAFESGTIAELQVPGFKKAVGIEIQGHPYLPIHDVQGTIRTLVDWKTGEITHVNSCDVFGNGINSQIPYAYAGKRYDSATGLLYFGKRFYDPKLGRWLTPDPLGSINHANLYQYVFNNPLCYQDPDGQFVIAIPLLIWAAELAIPTMYAAPIIYGAITGAVVYGGYKLVESMNEQGYSSTGDYYSGDLTPKYGLLDRVTKSGSVDPSLPTNPDDLLKRPGWKETTHPSAGKKGHRKFENEKTGEELRHDEGRPNESGHEKYDHYHRPNPNKTSKHDEYLDPNYNPVGKHSDASHLYAPENVWWNK